MFNGAFEAALAQSIDEELRLVLPEVTGSGFHEESLRDALDSEGPDSMTLIDVSEMERMLLVDRVGQRFMAHYGASVNQLSLRLAALLGLDAPTPTSNPFRPDVFVRAFLLAWEKSALDDQATEDLLRALDPRHSLDLAPLYADLNDALVQAGIEAQSVHRIKKSEDGAAASRSAPGAEEPSANPKSNFGSLEPERANAEGRGLAPAGRRIAAHARQFLNKLGWGSPGTQEASVAGGGEATYATADPEFMGYLGEMQAGADVSAPARIEEGEDPRSYNVLRQMLDREEVHRAPDLDRGTVDALAEVFDFVFSDPAIPLQLKYVIGRLQIPVLKAALIDREFFLSADHPARQLVDTLAMASIAWSPEKGEGDPLYQRVDNTVQRVLTEFEDDLALFSALLLDFTKFLFAVEEQVQGNIEPAVDQELVAVLPELVRNLNAGLDAIGWAGEARDIFTRRLISTHMAALRVKQPPPTDAASTGLEASAGKEAMKELDQRLATQLPSEGDDFDAIAQTFTRGLWFDFTVDKTTKHRCRLSWISPRRTRFLFTNRDGFDAFVRSEREVAKLLRRGKLSVIDQLPIVSRALDRIMSEQDPRPKP